MLLAAALILSPFAAGAAPVAEDSPYTIARTQVTTAAAPDGHPYRLFVAWPQGDPPAGGWPVLYLLDGADNFAVATDTARRLARAGARSGIRDGLIVGIDSGPLARRVLDYTPPAGPYRIPEGLPAHGLATGGADAFLDLLTMRILPYVTERWHIDKGRQTLAGHSFGGLLALHAAFTRPRLFTGYAAVSPSLWFGGGEPIARESKQADIAGTGFVIAVDDDEGGPNGGATTSARALSASLAQRGARSRYVELSGQGHGTTMLAAMGEVVALAFGPARP